MIEAARPFLNFAGFFPAYLLAGLGVAAVLWDSFAAEGSRRKSLLAFATGGVALAFLASVAMGLGGQTVAVAFQRSADPSSAAMLGLDSLSRPGGSIILLTGFMALLFVSDLFRFRTIPPGEFVSLTLLALAGAFFFVVSRELISLFLSLEILSISFYVLIALDRRSRRGNEAAVKYFILGSFASAIFVFGIAFIFGATGSTYFSEIEARLSGPGPSSDFFLVVGFALVFAGLFFKLAIAPFHMYAPDVYEGAPAPVAGLLATVGKVAGFVVLAKLAAIFGAWKSDFTQGLEYALSAAAILSIVVGNVGGILQSNVKRMLAYSSIAHSGYLLLGVLVIFRASETANTVLAAHAQSALLVYLLGYSVMTIVAFGAAGSLGRRGEMAIGGYAGLARRHPGPAAAMAISMISLTGIPPTVGFIGKLLVFQTVVEAGFYRHAIVAVVASVASAFYYLGVVVAMYMKPAREGKPLDEPSVPSGFALALGAAIILFLGVLPSLALALVG